MLIMVSNASVTVTSGQNNNFLTTVLPIDYTNFVSTNVSFYNGREKKTVKGTQIESRNSRRGMPIARTS